ncbi:hypothetical protein H6G33_09530 [Calothrix sp. FACHB-1219]|uniref:hypothetical protein n=1 Tax=unclassified Calothrix TaxID=2619626 RepID=UPI0016844EEC|nr:MULTISPECIES: hypothetical protein [unclassified Calothrix]MBD2201587.1 hypothetical protein [Calothrix sp. FACHB-168]MBD2217273.1 hypothetical protein [Calothrix sp. FACHB-1219]
MGVIYSLFRAVFRVKGEEDVSRTSEYFSNPADAMIFGAEYATECQEEDNEELEVYIVEERDSWYPISEEDEEVE